jgi:putative endonuclease
MKNHNYYIYILSNWNSKVIYVGVTNDLERRIFEHKNKIFEGFSKKYNIDKLVYYEHTNDVNAAIRREKEIKKWRREKKNKLIESMNPEWEDLAEKLFKYGLSFRVSETDEKSLLFKTQDFSLRSK